MHATPERLVLIAGGGEYPLLLAESAKRQGVGHLAVVALRGETDRNIGRHADDVAWFRVGQFGAVLEHLKRLAIPHAVMVGSVSPTCLFHFRLDAWTVAFLHRLPVWNAHSIFGAVVKELAGAGIEMLPAWRFMETHMPSPGLLAARTPTEQETRDIALGFKVALAVGALDIGQTVVVKDGAVLAVEGFEGTDEAIARGGRLGGPGAVVVKAAKAGHDMRFDIPVIGPRTMKSLRRIRAGALAVQAGRTIILGREDVVRAADRMGLCFLAH
jgi:UDP-2,3-diacylglucosamine hydrolase